ncbi:transcription termination factor Rho [Jatrophihabitans telluris]|uniref:Transcription termination factor Rho n=1 Tax=Jatrophihabitans telluris TaxID=2038343 RepID=A0ABY4R1Z0_9ACTN|nr:transcription termination factor Rho [Jatrophihabitans telluris]UQX89854.1 transcription termination factor Rho [Jatrophihabitans telluris]
MTDTQDQLDVLSSADSGVNDSSAARAKRRSGSLSTMLLPELQALASSMGLSTGKMRKSDLIVAIESASHPKGKTDRAPANTADRSPERASGRAPERETNADTDGGDTSSSAPKTRTRRAATRAAGPAQPTLDGEAGEVTSASGDAGNAGNAPRRSRSAQADSARAEGGAESGQNRTNGESASNASAGTESSSRRDSRDNQSRDGRDAQGRESRDNQSRDNQSREGQSREGQSRDNQSREGRDGQAREGRDGQAREGRDNQAREGRDNQAREGRDNQPREARDGQSRNERNRGQNSGNNSGNQGGQQNDRNRSQGNARNDRNDVRNDRNDVRNDSRDDEDDEFGGSRRGRRYRDRRGRNRERFDGGPAGGNRQEVEPTVSDDDILIPVAGILDEVSDKNTWFIRTNGYFASTDDVYVANSHIRRFELRRGDAVTGAVKQPREGERKEKFNPLVRLDTVNGVEPEKARNRVEFTKLTPLYPQDRLRLETEPNILTTRVIDLVMPIGKGQRALVVSPPKAGKTSVLQAIANAIAVNNPECHLMVVLVDERPEEVTDMQRSVKGEVIASTFDRRPQDHTMIAELSIERAKRLVEMGHDVVVLLDSITRLGRAYNLAAPASGRILSGGVDSTALYPPKRFLGAARNIENGGSLTIIATALVETGSTMDTVIFEEFKGTGNAELILDRKIADKRVFPAVNVDTSGTRKEEILMAPDELNVVLKLRRVLHALDPQQGIDLLLDRLKKSRTNIEFLMQIAKTAPGGDDR